MVEVNSKQQMIENIEVLDTYIYQNCDPEREFALDLIKRGICFVTVFNNGDYRFYPSRFLGYRKNDMDAHLNNWNKDGKETNPVISKIIGITPSYDLELENEYRKYCERLGFVAWNKGAFGIQRKFWRIEIN